MYPSSVPRFPPLQLTTPPNIGPFSYVLDDSFRSNKDNLIPFLSSTKRLPDTKKPFTEQLYDFEKKSDIVGGQSMRYTAPRFDYKSENVEKKKIVQKKRKISAKKGKLYVCKVPFNLMGSFPSIPAKSDADGYDFDNNGVLKKIVKKIDKNFPGPQTYQVTATCESPYKGNRWSRMTSKRCVATLGDAPGPASYNVNQRKLSENERRQEEFRQMARTLTYLPRYLDQQEQKIAQENLPAPNAYPAPPSDFDAKPYITCIAKPFLISTSRFGDVAGAATPSPASYDTGGRLGCKTGPSIKRVPFTFARGRDDSRANIATPGPGDYETSSGMGSVDKKRSRAPFNSSNARKIDYGSEEKRFFPNCATYPRESPPPFDRVQNPNSIFVSSTDRFDRDLPPGPPPSKYHTATSYDNARCRTSHQKKKLHFVFQTERKPPVDTHALNPGPADYLGPEDVEYKGFVFERSERFVTPRFRTPPPDHYFIYPSHTDSFFRTKDTYNLKIAENVLKKKIMLSPRETRKKFIEMLRSKKKLRCFNPVIL